MHRLKTFASLLLTSLPILGGCQHTESFQTPKGAYAEVNGLRMYYEDTGPQEGVPLIMLHGGGSIIETNFSELRPLLAKDRRIIAVEEDGHGRSGSREGPGSFEQTAGMFRLQISKLQERILDSPR